MLDANSCRCTSLGSRKPTKEKIAVHVAFRARRWTGHAVGIRRQRWTSTKSRPAAIACTRATRVRRENEEWRSVVECIKFSSVSNPDPVQFCEAQHGPEQLGQHTVRSWPRCFAEVRHQNTENHACITGWRIQSNPHHLSFNVQNGIHITHLPTNPCSCRICSASARYPYEFSVVLLITPSRALRIRASCSCCCNLPYRRLKPMSLRSFLYCQRVILCPSAFNIRTVILSPQSRCVLYC